MPWPGRDFGRPDLEHLGLGVDRVAGEHRRRSARCSQPRFATAFWLTSSTDSPVTIGQRQRGHHERLAELGPRRVVRVVVDVVGVVGEQREPGVVGLGDGPAVGVAVDVADREVLQEPALPADDGSVRDRSLGRRGGVARAGVERRLPHPPAHRASMTPRPSARWASNRPSAVACRRTDPRMPVGRPVGHHAVDHRRALAVRRDRHVVRLELRRLDLQRGVGQARLEGQEHREQLGRVADPLAEHPERRAPGPRRGTPGCIRSRNRVRLRGRVQRRVGDRVVEGHAVDGRHADRARDVHDLRPRPVRERMLVARSSAARGRRSSRRARRRARTGGRAAPRAIAGELRRRPARLHEVRDPDAADGQPERPLRLASACRGPGRPPPDARPWGTRCRRAGGSVARNAPRAPQQRVQLADGRLEVEARRPVEAQAARAPAAPVRVSQHVATRRPGAGSASSVSARRPPHRASRAEPGVARRAAWPRRARDRRRADRRAPRRPTPKRSRMRAIGRCRPRRPCAPWLDRSGVVK